MYSDSGQGGCQYALPTYKKDKLNKAIDDFINSTTNLESIHLATLLKALINEIE